LTFNGLHGVISQRIVTLQSLLMSTMIYLNLPSQILRYQFVPVLLSQGIKRPGRKSDRSPLI
jgi:hypothetical protein